MPEIIIPKWRQRKKSWIEQRAEQMLAHKAIGATVSIGGVTYKKYSLTRIEQVRD